MTPASRSSADRKGSERIPALPEATLSAIEQHLKQREERRDALLDRARKLRRQAQFVMNQLHQGRRLEEALAELRAGARALTASVREEPGVDPGAAVTALQECVEGLLLAATLAGEKLPGPDELGVEPEPYLLGLGDLVGELRRHVLQELSEGALAEAEEMLMLMEELTHVLARFEAPRAIVALKPKQDQARAILERTRGDLTLARLLARARLPAPPPEEP